MGDAGKRGRGSQPLAQARGHFLQHQLARGVTASKCEFTEVIKVERHDHQRAVVGCFEGVEHRPLGRDAWDVERHFAVNVCEACPKSFARDQVKDD